MTNISGGVYWVVRRLLILVLTGLMLPIAGIAQAYTSYLTGDATDVTTVPLSGVVLMGGASENDNAMRWFLERADGGDVIVLRTSGDDGYNDYFYSDLGVTLNSVETIVCNDATSGSDAYVLQQVQNAEALWFAGGDQWDYISFWRDTPLEGVFNDLINIKKITIGGTSAGCAIQGQAYFSAENGTVTSNMALNNPYHNLMTLGYNDFLQHAGLDATITDTHYDNPDRRGRHAAFLARLYTDHGLPFVGIGVEEYTAVCVDENNIAHVYGSYPDYDDFAFFLQPNCFLPNGPETCVDGDAITWDRSDAALKVLRIPGTEEGTATFDLNDWKTATGDDLMWQNWWVEDGDLLVTEEAGPLDCDTVLTVQSIVDFPGSVYPNPSSSVLQIDTDISGDITYRIYAVSGDILLQGELSGRSHIDVASLAPGLYTLQMLIQDQWVSTNFIRQ